MIRAFLAFNISNEVKENLSRLISKLSRSVDQIKWVDPKQIHCTLKFFGDVDEKQLFDEIFPAIKKEVEENKKINLECLGLGAFPSLNSPKVVWAGLKGDLEKVSNLFLKLENLFETLGFEREKRSFNPHLTIGRVKGFVKNLNQFIELMNVENAKSFGKFSVESLTMYKSVLTREGSIYTVLREFPLTGGK